MVVYPIARFLVGIEQPFLGYFVGRAGRLGAGNADGGDHGCEHGGSQKKSLPYYLRHGGSSWFRI